MKSESKEQLLCQVEGLEALRDRLQNYVTQAPIMLNERAEQLARALEADFCMFDTNLIKVHRGEKWCAAEVGINSDGEVDWFLIISSFDAPEQWRAYQAPDLAPFDLLQHIRYVPNEGFFNTSEKVDIYVMDL